jgi:hypothetical protein
MDAVFNSEVLEEDAMTAFKVAAAAFAVLAVLYATGVMVAGAWAPTLMAAYLALLHWIMSKAEVER